jgi:hypothetical protein
VPGIRPGDVHVLRVRVPSPETYDRLGKRSRTGFCPPLARGKLTETSRKIASWGCIGARLGVWRVSRRKRTPCNGVADLFHRVLSERGEPCRRTRRSSFDAMGEAEVQAARRHGVARAAPGCAAGSDSRDDRAQTSTLMGIRTTAYSTAAPTCGRTVPSDLTAQGRKL